MDAFTQKLLERTQARKEQLAMKRKELDDCRANRTPPRRKPLTDDNNELLSDKKEKDNLKVAQGGTLSPIAKNSAVVCSKTNNSRVTKVKETEAGSPSIQARRERLIKMQQRDQENCVVSPKKHWKQLPGAKGADNSSPSVATRSAVFQSKVNEQNKSSEKRYMPPLTEGDGTPKVSATKRLFEKGPTSNSEQQNGKSAKQTLNGPPKPPRLNEEQKEVNSQQAVKRKAPPTPQKKSDLTVEPKPTKPKAPVPMPRDERCSTEKGETLEPVWVKRQRTESKDTTDGKANESNESKKETKEKSKKEVASEMVPKPVPRKRAKSAEDKLLSSESTSSSTQQVAEQKNKGSWNIKKAKTENSLQTQPSQNKTDDDRPDTRCSSKTTKRSLAKDKAMVVQACVVAEDIAANKNSTKCNRASVVRVQAISSSNNNDEKNIQTQSSDVHNSLEACASQTGLIASDVPANGRKGHEIKIEKPEFKMPDIPVGASHGNLNETIVDLNETVNLNDVNIHEITFNIDFSKFDNALQQERESMFKTSFEDRCKKEEDKSKEKRRRSKSVPDELELKSVPPRPPPPVHPVVKEGKIHQSGYTAASEHFATSTTPKEKKRGCKPQNTQAKIQSLLEEAASQQNIVLQASQLLNCCAATNDVFRGSPEEVEAERVLLVATEHRTACLDEVQRLKTAPDQDISEFISNCEASVTPCMGKLFISDIRLPLRQEFMDVLRLGIRSDLGVFHFVCIIQHGPSTMFCSRVMSTYDATEGNFLRFPDKFVIDNLMPDFSVDVKIFCMNVKKNLPVVSTTQKHKLFQSPKVGKKHGGRKGIESSSPAVPPAASPKTVFRTSCFTLVGFTSVTLPLLKSSKFSLDKVPQGCPLNTFIELKCDCTPQYTSHVSGFLTILEDVGGYGAWQRRWCVLEGDSLQYWRYPGDEAIKPPLGTIDLSSCISESITTVARDLCARPNTVEMVVRRKTGDQTTSEVKYLLAADNKTDRVTWINTLNEALKDWKAWNTGSFTSKLGRVHNKDVFMCSASSPQQV